MKNRNLSVRDFPSFTDQEAELVVGGANMPFPEFWQKMAGALLEVVLSAALEELRKYFHPKRRGAEC